MVLLPLLLACVPPDAPVRGIVDVPAAPPRALVLQTEGEAWRLVRDTLAGEGLPHTDAAELIFSEQVAWTSSEGTTIVARRFLAGPAVARERLGELGLDLGPGSEADLWESSQALSLGALAFELSRVVARDRGAEGAGDDAVDLPRAALLERATLHLLASRGLIPVTWPDRAATLICALAEAPGGAELHAAERCAATKLPPPALSALLDRYAPAPLDLFSALVSPGGERAEELVALEALGVRWTREEDTLTLRPAAGGWEARLAVGEGRDALDGDLTLPVTVDATTRPRLLELANELNLAFREDGLRWTLSPGALEATLDGYEVASPLTSVALAARLSELGAATAAALPGLLAGTLAPAAAAQAVVDRVLGPSEAP